MQSRSQRTHLQDLPYNTAASAHCHTDAYRNTAEKLRGLLRGIILRLIHLTAVRNTSGSVFFLILLSKTFNIRVPGGFDSPCD